MRAFIGIILTLACLLPRVGRADVVIIPDTPLGHFSAALGEQVGQAFAAASQIQQHSHALLATVQNARKALDACGDCSDAPRLRAELDQARRTEQTEREGTLAVVEDSDRKYGTHLGRLLTTLMGPGSAENANISFAGQLIAAYCYATEGGTVLPRDWKRIDGCKSQISPTAFADLNYKASAECLRHAQEVSGYDDDGAPRYDAPRPVQDAWRKLRIAKDACDENTPFKKIAVAARAGCHLAPDYYFKPGQLDVGFQMDCDRGPLPKRPLNPPLASRTVVPLATAAFGNNNSAALGVPQRLAPIFDAMVATGRYKILECVYGIGEFAKTVRYWFENAPPNYAEVVIIASSGNAYGDAAYLGTTGVSDCPADEQGAKTRTSSLWNSRTRPDPVSVPAVESVSPARADLIGKVSRDAGWSWNPPANVVVVPKREQFQSEIAKVAAGGQQVLLCSYFPVNGIIEYRMYWKGSPPPNIAALLSTETSGSGVVPSMGIRGLDACPATWGDVEPLRKSIQSEAAKFASKY